ncbi:MAG: manganese catalase family protein [Flavobacteriales bacterium]
MFHHVKELQFKARVSRPDPRFARLLLEQFGGGNGELKAAMQYFVQAFAARHPYPDKYDMLMDIATEEFSHLEIVGATIQMLLSGVNGELKNVAEESELTRLLDGRDSRDTYIHEAMMNPQFFVLSGGGPIVCDSGGNPWSGAYVNANGDLSVDLRSDIAAEARAKIVYEYLMQFTDDPDVKETLNFLMTREIAHAQMFQAALDTIEPNFPPGILQGDPRYSNTYFNLSERDGEPIRSTWNQGASACLGEHWQFIEDPRSYVRETDGLTQTEARGTVRTEESIRTRERELSVRRSREVNDASGQRDLEWGRD